MRGKGDWRREGEGGEGKGKGKKGRGVVGEKKGKGGEGGIGGRMGGKDKGDKGVTGETGAREVFKEKNSWRCLVKARTNMKNTKETVYHCHSSCETFVQFDVSFSDLYLLHPL